MAQKKGFIYKMMMGKDDQADFDVSKLPSTRWRVFKDIFRNRFGALVKTNLLVLLFCLPAIAWLVYCVMTGIMSEANIGYTGNLGFGLSSTAQAILFGRTVNMQITILQYAVLIPGIMIASIGFAGAFYTYKKLIWGEGISVAQTFFKGIKENFLTFLWTSLFLAGSILLLAFNVASIGLQPNQVISILAIVASSILLVIVLFMSVFMWTQCVTYKMKPWVLLKNSFLLSIGMLLQNVFFVGISIIPIVLMIFLPITFSMIIMLIYALVGFSFTFLVWTIYAHYGFDKYLNDRTPGAIKDHGINRMTQEAKDAIQVEASERRRKTANVRYANPKKGKRAEEEPTITPLADTFSRKELERLATEKKAFAKTEDESIESEVDTTILNDAEAVKENGKDKK